MENKLVVEMNLTDEKKHSVKFFTAVEGVPFDNLYVKKTDIPKNCKAVRVTLEFI